MHKVDWREKCLDEALRFDLHLSFGNSGRHHYNQLRLVLKYTGLFVDNRLFNEWTKSFSLLTWLTGGRSKHRADPWEWCSGRDRSADHMHLSGTGIHSHWLLCQQWVHRPWASGKPTSQTRLHTGETLHLDPALPTNSCFHPPFLCALWDIS